MKWMLAIALMLAPQVCFADRLFAINEVHISENGGYFGQILKEMTADEYAGFVSAACSFYGGDCSQLTQKVQIGSKIGSGDYRSDSGNAYFTGELVSHEGENWNIKVTAPDGYEVCRVKLDAGRSEISGKSSFDLTLLEDRVDMVVGVPNANGGTSQAVNAYYAVEYVSAGTRAEHQCFPNKTVMWTCKGLRCEKYLKGQFSLME